MRTAEGRPGRPCRSFLNRNEIVQINPMSQHKGWQLILRRYNVTLYNYLMEGELIPKPDSESQN